MTKLYPCLLFLVFTASASFAQATTDPTMAKQLQALRNLYHLADSLNKLGQLYVVDSAVVGRAKLLDKEHPTKYFEAIGESMKESKFNDAAFLYFVGRLRYRYYNAVNPDYQASGDGALLASLDYMFGENIKLYMKTNIDNFLAVLKASDDYFANNDYAIYPKAKNPGKYDTLSTWYVTLMQDLETNKEKYRKQWDEDRIQLMKNIDEQIDAYNKMRPEEKQRSKNNNW
jgi:hypothetical protein